MKVFILSMAKSVQRRESIIAQCEKNKLDYEVIEAVDGNALSEEERFKHTQKLNYAFQNGEIGCALSHQKIYQKMLDENISNALILEDDAAISNSIDVVLDSFPYATNQAVPTIILLSKVNKLINKPLFSIDKKYSLYPVYHATTSHGYIINQAAAAALLQFLYPVWMVADKWSLFEEYAKVKVLAVHPAAILLSGHATVSTINPANNPCAISAKKKKVWGELMALKPLKVKLKHKIRKLIIPLFSEIIDLKKPVP